MTRSMLLLLAAGAVMLAPGFRAHAEQAKPAKQAKQAQQAPQPKQAAIVIDANTGKVLHAQSADEARFPASLTKMMTLYMLFGEIEQGRLSYQSKIVFSERATAVAPSKLGLEVGEEITVLEAIKALVVKSANDVAVAVAEQIGGTEHQFARLMTERARQIGMTSTTFRNASGLPNPAQRSTARDMTTLALRLQDDYPHHYFLFSTTSFTFRGKTYRTHNTLMSGFPGMDGIKTGYTRASGFNLVSSVRADGKHIVGAVFGGKTAATRNAHMRSLLYTALQKASTSKTRGPQLIAQARPAKPPTDAGWSAKTKASQPAKPAPTKPPAKVVQAPPPAPAVRPARDVIADVLAEGDVSSAGPGEGTEQVAASTVTPPPRLDLEALRAAMSEAQDDQGQAPAQMLQGGTSGPQDIAGLIRNSIVEGAPDAPAGAMPVSDAPAARPPSTLESQASALAFAQAGALGGGGTSARPSRPSVPPSHLKGPMPSQFPAAPVGAGYEIQIGAYSTAQEAQTKLELVRARAVGLLEGHSGVTLPVQRDDRQIFRARFVNFNESAASNTCLELRRLAIDCFVMKAD
ncbi:serine hydrolase [Hyphomicrobium sp.]|uniref:serine hydrolase n=1 Tax=Hyphomicrobium sp. TaxID=82 RepID=UPI0025BA8BA1|nr:serine hydrolase [Hyphomicrobium sp.]MCC7253764.1 serine hydrolase [Hyphomicrobium sp.]